MQKVLCCAGIFLAGMSFLCNGNIAVYKNNISNCKRCGSNLSKFFPKALSVDFLCFSNLISHILIAHYYY